jgi:hypothetical protein
MRTAEQGFPIKKGHEPNLQSVPLASKKFRQTFIRQEPHQ